MSKNDFAGLLELPQYLSYKKVWALRIKRIDFVETGGAVITPEEYGYSPFEVDDAYIQKHGPQIGGYYVVYEDGYKSFSPASAFEKGYALILRGPHGSPSIKKANLE